MISHGSVSIIVTYNAELCLLMKQALAPLLPTFEISCCHELTACLQQTLACCEHGMPGTLFDYMTRVVKKHIPQN